MTDVKALRDVIEAKGMTVSSLARVIGMQKQTLFNRMEKPDFKLSEVTLISDALHLDPATRERIFFNSKGDDSHGIKELMDTQKGGI